jgi:hypothetical protein
MPSEALGRTMVGKPAAVAQPRRQRDPRPCAPGVANAVDRAGQAQAPRGVEQELAQPVRALAVAPVADPHEVGLGLHVRARREDPRVGRLVPGPRAPRPAALDIDAPDDLAEGEHAVVCAQVEAGHRARLRGRAVVRVVKEQPVAARALAVRADAGDELRVAPLVHEHEIGAVERHVEVERRQVVGRARELRERAREVLLARAPVLRHEIRPAPSAGGLEHAHVVAAIEQLGRDAAQEVRVAVVPVADQRVAEDDDPHAATGTSSS